MAPKGLTVKQITEKPEQWALARGNFAEIACGGHGKVDLRTGEAAIALLTNWS